MSKNHKCDPFYTRVACVDCGADMCGDCDEIVRYIRGAQSDALCGDCYHAARTADGYCDSCLEHLVPQPGDRCLMCMTAEAEAMLEAV